MAKTGTLIDSSCLSFCRSVCCQFIPKLLGLHSWKEEVLGEPLYDFLRKTKETYEMKLKKKQHKPHRYSVSICFVTPLKITNELNEFEPSATWQ